MDVVTEWIQATINGTWDSTKMRKGLFRKGGEMLVIAIAWVVGIAIPMDINIAVFFSAYIVLMELVSVIENLDLAGIPMPTWLINMGMYVNNTYTITSNDDTEEWWFSTYFNGVAPTFKITASANTTISTLSYKASKY